MTSKQLAKRGPKTAPGKLAVSTNASTHGILSPRPVVAAYESQGAWKAHRQAILDSLDPKGGIEQALAERVALCSWRLNRVIFYETEKISELQEAAIKDATESTYLTPLYGATRDADGAIFERVEKARAIYEDISLLFNDSAEDLGSPHTVEWVYEQAPYHATELVAYQEAEATGLSVEEIDEFELNQKADTLEDKLRKHAGGGFILTVSEMREALGWLADEAGLENSIGVDGQICYTPLEGLLQRLCTVAEGSIAAAEEKAREFEEKILNQRRARILPVESDLQKISRYEAHISREMYKALHELEALQKQRAGGVAPLARIDVHGDGLPEP